MKFQWCAVIEILNKTCFLTIKQMYIDIWCILMKDIHILFTFYLLKFYGIILQMQIIYLELHILILFSNFTGALIIE